MYIYCIYIYNTCTVFDFCCGYLNSFYILFNACLFCQRLVLKWCRRLWETGGLF